MTGGHAGNREQEDRYLTAVECVLGMLDDAEAAAFRGAAGSNDSIQSDLRKAAGDLCELVTLLTPETPDTRVKARFLQAIRPAPGRQSDSRKLPSGAIRSGQGRWRPAPHPGITFKPLYFNKESGLLTMLVRMEPGASYPAHRHSRPEQCLVLEGDLIHDNHVYGPGDFTWAEAGSIDPALHTKTGNLLLMISEPETQAV